MKIKFYDSHHDKCVDAITRYYIATSVAFLIKVNLSFLPVFLWNIQRVTQHTTKAELIKAAASLRVLICCMCCGTFVAWLLRWAKIEGSSATLILTCTINEDSSGLWKPDRFNSPATQYCFFLQTRMKNKIEKQRDKGVSGRMSTLFLPSIFQKQCDVLYFFFFFYFSSYYTRRTHLAMEDWLNAFFSQQIMVHIFLILSHTNYVLCKIL